MIKITNKVADVREWFRELKANQEYVVDKTGCKMLEVVGATFIADEETIFGAVSRDYVERELKWYESQSLNVNDIPGGAPKIWAACATKEGLINSNYGYLCWNKDNYNQYDHVVQELKDNPESRRATMIYTRPSMWYDYNKNGMSDFVCTQATQHFIRNGKLISLVQMRSNDVWAGYRNDRAWHKHVQKLLVADLGCEMGELIWHAGSLHCYERNFDLIK